MLVLHSHIHFSLLSPTYQTLAVCLSWAQGGAGHPSHTCGEPCGWDQSRVCSYRLHRCGLRTLSWGCCADEGEVPAQRKRFLSSSCYIVLL